MPNPNRFKIPSLYKKFLLLVIVIGPIYWLMFTEDGRRRTDLVVLSLAGNPTAELRLDILSSAASEEKFREFLPQLEWQCDDQPNPFGDRACGSTLGAFNDTPAHFMTLYFSQGALSAMKVLYRGAYHDWLVSQLHRMLGPPETSGERVLQWDTGHGLVLMQKELQPDADRDAMMWLSAETARKRAPGSEPENGG